MRSHVFYNLSQIILKLPPRALIINPRKIAHEQKYGIDNMI